MNSERKAADKCRCPYHCPLDDDVKDKSAQLLLSAYKQIRLANVNRFDSGPRTSDGVERFGPPEKAQTRITLDTTVDCNPANQAGL